MSDERAKVDANYKGVSTAVTNDSNQHIKMLRVDPSTGRLLVATSGGGEAGTEYTDGDVAPANPVGGIPVFDNAGTITAVSNTNPLPVSASIDTTGLALAANQQTDALTDTQLRATAVPVSISGNQAVNVAQMNGVATTMDNGTSGTGVQRVTIASDSTGQVIVRGAAAHDAAVSGNPVLNGAEARSSDQNAVGNGDITRLQATLTGKLVTLPYATPERSLSGTASATNTSDTAVIAAQGDGIRIYVTSIIISNSSATNTEVVIKSATTALLTYPAPANSGAVHSLTTPLRLTANEALNFASLASVTTMKVSAVGYAGV